jgi:SAM-dependent methyltransferase
MIAPRLEPPFWRHDAYTLRRLAAALRAVVEPLQAGWRPGATVIDFGAGDAPYRSLFDAAKARYICCDLGEGAEVAIEPGRPVALADAVADAVVSFQVLEHVWDLDWYLGECARLLKADGTLILSTHGTWPYHPHPTDFRRWTRDGLVAELESRGFVIRELRPLLGPLAWTTQFRALGYHAVLSKLPLLGPLLSAGVCALMHLRMTIEDKLTPPEWIATNAAVYVVVAQKAAP